jgi:hypothetical protein
MRFLMTDLTVNDNETDEDNDGNSLLGSEASSLESFISGNKRGGGGSRNSHNSGNSHTSRGSGGGGGAGSCNSTPERRRSSANQLAAFGNGLGYMGDR